MGTRLLPVPQSAKIVLTALALGSFLFGQQHETSTTRLLKSGEADQIAYLNEFIAEGVQIPNEEVGILILSNTSLFVPIIERKIEEILRSSSRRESWFKNPSVDPDRAVDILMAMIEYTSEKIALEQASKLMKIDEDRFGTFVARCLGNADARGKGFQIAYQGLEVGDTAVDRRIMFWVEGEIGAGSEPNRTIILRRWAEAMVEAYNGAPDEYQFAKDPIVSRLSAARLNPPGGRPLHEEMFRLFAEAVQKRPKKSVH